MIFFKADADHVERERSKWQRNVGHQADRFSGQARFLHDYFLNGVRRQVSSNKTPVGGFWQVEPLASSKNRRSARFKYGVSIAVEVGCFISDADQVARDARTNSESCSVRMSSRKIMGSES